MEKTVNELLREWFSNQKEYKSLKEFSNYLEIPYSTLKKHFFTNNPRTPSGKHREKLYFLTKLECLKPLKNNREVNPLIFNKTRSFSEKLKSLCEEMEWFFNASPHARKTLRHELKNELSDFYCLTRALTSEQAREIVIKEGGVSDNGVKRKN